MGFVTISEEPLWSIMDNEYFPFPTINLLLQIYHYVGHHGDEPLPEIAKNADGKMVHFNSPVIVIRIYSSQSTHGHKNQILTQITIIIGDDDL